MKTPEQIAEETYKRHTVSSDPAILANALKEWMRLAIEADRAQRPEGQEDTERVVFYWSRNHGDCRDCGNPAAFIAPYRYGPSRREDAILCALCAANDAADGEPIERIEAQA